jgi:predicted  nucleic acid-binding Zn-ribbon protein
MQHIPHHSLEDIERSREEMAAFMNERPAYPDLTLSGEDIHNAYNRVENQSKPWEELSVAAKTLYEALATELNRELDARQAWFEGEDKVTISGVRCRTCNAMLDSEHAEGHACWQKVK